MGAPAGTGRRRTAVRPVNWPDGPRPAGERPAEVVRVQANASVNRLYIAACDRRGTERGVDWVGGSVIVDANGYPLAGPLHGAAADPAIILAHLDLSEAATSASAPTITYIRTASRHSTIECIARLTPPLPNRRRPCRRCLTHISPHARQNH